MACAIKICGTQNVGRVVGGLVPCLNNRSSQLGRIGGRLQKCNSLASEAFAAIHNAKHSELHMPLTSTRALSTKPLNPGRRTTEPEVLLHSVPDRLSGPCTARGDDGVGTTDFKSLRQWTELPDGAPWWILDGYMHTAQMC